jgi:hypothetical protein
MTWRNIARPDHGFERLIDVHDVGCKTGHRRVHIQRRPSSDEALHDLFVKRDDRIFFDELARHLRFLMNRLMTGRDLAANISNFIRQAGFGMEALLR